MYNNYFGLYEEPFSITPDPRFLYLTNQHQEAIDHLLYGIRQRKGFILLTGEVGAGKTTICRAVLNELGEDFHTALIFNPDLSRNQLLRAIIEEFGLWAASSDRLDHLNLLNDYLLKINSAGHDAVLIIDEAQNMSVAALEMVRMLSNLETERRKLLQIVLVGQPELRATLAGNELRQLSQRITVRYHLGNMTKSDTANYLRHRITVAAGKNDKSFVRFEPGAIREIFRRSGGTPRLVNALSDKALLAGYVKRTGKISRRLVRLAAKELCA